MHTSAKLVLPDYSSQAKDGPSVEGRFVSLDLLIQMRSELSPKSTPAHMSERGRRG